MSVSDRVVFNTAIDRPVPDELAGVASSMQVNWIEDQQSGNYSGGQCIFDTASQTNNGKLFDHSSDTIVFPILMTLKNTSASGAAGTPTGFAAAFKDCYTNIINSLQVELNGQTFVFTKPYLNQIINYKIKTLFSTNEALKFNQSLGLSTDTPGSYQFSASASTDGDGYSNNRMVAIGANAFTTPDQYNDGLYKRAQTTSYPANGYGAMTAMASGSNTTKNSYCVQEGKNYCTLATTAAAGVVMARWMITAEVRVADCCDLVKQLKMSRGLQKRYTIGLNQGTARISVGSTGTTLALAANPIMTSGTTFPAMLASAAALQPNLSGTRTLASTTTELSLSVGVGGNDTDGWNGTGSGFLPLQKARLYTNSYVLHPDKMREYIAHPVHSISHVSNYDYVYSTGWTANSNPNINITQTIRNPEFVLIIPYANTATSGSVFATATCPVFQSPFDTAPATTTPLLSISNLQVLVAGETVFYQPEQYSFDQFLNEFNKHNAINGNETDGITSGIISPYMWDNAYRVCVADVSRFNSPENKNLPVSISVNFLQNTNITVDYLCVAMKREHLDQNVLDGSVRS